MPPLHDGAELETHSTAQPPASTVSSSSDLDHDGRDDLIERGADEQSAFVRIRTASGERIIRPPVQPDAFGRSMAIIGDIDRDGVDDVAITSPKDHSESNRSGRVYVCSSATGQVLLTLFGAPNERFALDASPAGDLNLDGVPDISSIAVAQRADGAATVIRHVFSGRDGRRLMDHIEATTSKTVRRPAPLLPGDIDATWM